MELVKERQRPTSTSTKKKVSPTTKQQNKSLLYTLGGIAGGLALLALATPEEEQLAKETTVITHRDKWATKLKQQTAPGVFITDDCYVTFDARYVPGVPNQSIREYWYEFGDDIEDSEQLSEPAIFSNLVMLGKNWLVVSSGPMGLGTSPDTLHTEEDKSAISEFYVKQCGPNYQTNAKAAGEMLWDNVKWIVDTHKSVLQEQETLAAKHRTVLELPHVDYRIESSSTTQLIVGESGIFDTIKIQAYNKEGAVIGDGVTIAIKTRNLDIDNEALRKTHIIWSFPDQANSHDETKNGAICGIRCWADKDTDGLGIGEKGRIATWLRAQWLPHMGCPEDQRGPLADAIVDRAFKHYEGVV